MTDASTAERVLQALEPFGLRKEGPSEYRSNRPWKPGSDSLGLAVKIDGPEHGSYFDHVDGTGGSLYDLAKKLKISPQKPTSSNGSKPAASLEEYARAHGVDPSVFEAAGWREEPYPYSGPDHNRPALRFKTLSGERWRFLDGEKPKFKSSLGYQACWYGLKRAAEAAKNGNGALVLCNGEPSVVAGQHYGLSACAVTGGEHSTIPERLLGELTASFPEGDIILTPDCDETGHKWAKGLEKQLTEAGYNVFALELNGSKGFDLADFCALHQEKSQENLATLDFINLEVDEPSADVCSLPEPGFDIPPLPESAALDASLGESTGEWIDAYVRYADQVSPMTPRLFHESAALWMASVVIARRLKLELHFGPIYPNLFILWLASTTLHRKTTGLNISRRILNLKGFSCLLAAQDTTPEAFLSDLAGKEPSGWDKLSPAEQAEWAEERNYSAQKGWILDELSGLLGASGKDYNQGLTESILRFYDCDDRYVRSTRSQGRVTVRNSYISILGASTPAAVAPHLQAERLWSMGFWPRFALLTPENERPAWREPVDEPREPEVIRKGLAILFDQLPEAVYPKPARALSVSLGAGVHDAWRRYNRALSYDLLTPELDNRLYGTYGRLPSQVLKIAIILAALDWRSGEAPRVELPHLARAIQTAEAWRRSAHRTLTQANMDEIDRLQRRILSQVQKVEPSGCTIREIYKGMADKKPSEIEMTVFEMVTAGYLEEVESKSGKKGGRPTKRYRLARE